MVLRTLSKSALERAPQKNKINPMNTPYITLLLIKVHMALILDSLRWFTLLNTHYI